MIIELEGKLLTQATIIARLKGVELEKYVKKCVVKDVEESKNDLFRLFEEPKVAVVEEEPDEVKSPVHITVNRYDMDGPVQAYSTATPFNELYLGLELEDDSREPYMVYHRYGRNQTSTVCYLWELLYICETFRLNNQHRNCRVLSDELGRHVNYVNKIAVNYLNGNLRDYLRRWVLLLGGHRFGKQGNELYIDGESTHLNLQEAKNIVATIHNKGNWIKCMYSFIEEWGCRAIDVLPEHVMFICADNKSKSLISLLKIGGEFNSSSKCFGGLSG